jgi:hypothetical protein
MKFSRETGAGLAWLLLFALLTGNALYDRKKHQHRIWWWRRKLRSPSRQALAVANWNGATLSEFCR